MKKYMTPELKALAFVAEEAISVNDLDGNLSVSENDLNNTYNNKEANYVPGLGGDQLNIG